MIGLLEDIKSKLKHLMKNNGSTEEKSLLRFVLGEVTRKKPDPSDMEILACIAKTIKTNSDVASKLEGDESRQHNIDQCNKENVILKSLIPSRALNKENIKSIIYSLDLDLSSNPGKLTGIIIGKLKSTNELFIQSDVSDCLSEILSTQQ